MSFYKIIGLTSFSELSDFSEEEREALCNAWVERIYKGKECKEWEEDGLQCPVQTWPALIVFLSIIPFIVLPYFNFHFGYCVVGGVAVGLLLAACFPRLCIAFNRKCFSDFIKVTAEAGKLPKMVARRKEEQLKAKRDMKAALPILAVAAAAWFTSPQQRDLEFKLGQQGWLAPSVKVTDLYLGKFANVSGISGAGAMYLGVFGTWFKLPIDVETRWGSGK